MESLEDSNCHSMTDSLSLYERYLRSFNVVDSFVEENRGPAPSNCEYETCDGNSNGDFSVNKLGELVQSNLLHPLVNNVDKVDLGADLCMKDYSNLYASPAASTENSSATASHSILTEKSDPADVPGFSEDSKSGCFKQPVFITPTMENSNNAVDSVPMFRNVGRSESVFKLPISELTFNGTIKSIQKLKPIVDPITALSSHTEVSDEVTDKHVVEPFEVRASSSIMGADPKHNNEEIEASSESSEVNRMDKGNDSTGDSQYEEYNLKIVEEGNLKWNEQSYSSLEGSFDSGVRSPDMFSDDDAPEHEPPESFWNFLVDYEKHDKSIVQKLEATLQGVLPPPSVTTLKTDVTEMLKKYHSHHSMFSDEKVTAEASSTTPVKRVSFIQIPSESMDSMKEPLEVSLKDTETPTESHSTDNAKPDDDTSLDKSIQLKMNTEIEAKETAWPDVMKCRHYDLHYNLTRHSERVEQLAARLGERFVGAETACSVGGPAAGRSPGSAAKAKALRIKLAQAKSPGRRLSHLARRRQVFASAATVAAGAQPGQRMVLIDRNFFQHRKLISSAERRSPRLKRTPGKRTPGRKSPARPTPAKTPRSGGSARRRGPPPRPDGPPGRTPPRESLIKRALFVSPEQRARPQPSGSAPPRRALFGADGPAPASQPAAKRPRDASPGEPRQGRSKVAKSLSFGGDSLAPAGAAALGRRASDVLPTDRNPFDLNETHKKKLLWAVSEALRAHGWRMSRAGFREKAAALARLTRRLLTLRPHAARFAAPQLSSSETMLRVARLYAYAVIQGRTVEECFLEEQARVAGEASAKLTGYISAADYQRLRPQAPAADRVKENQAAGSQPQPKPDQPRSSTKKVLQDTTVNIDSNSNSSGSSVSLDTSVLFKSQSMPSFEEAAKMKASRLVSATWSSLKNDFTKSILSPL